MIVLDVSKSMLAADVAPSRLHESLRQLREALKPSVDESVGIVVFAGDSLLACPLTVDAGAVVAALELLESPPISGGTSLASGLSRASSALPESSGASQTIILVSDGEETQPGNIGDLSGLQTR